MGVVQNYGAPKLPLRPFANLSSLFAPQQNRDREHDHVFVCIFRSKDLQYHYMESLVKIGNTWVCSSHRVDGIRQVSVSVRKFDFWTSVLHLLFEKFLELRRCRMN